MSTCIVLSFRKYLSNDKQVRYFYLKCKKERYIYYVALFENIGFKKQLYV